jgi:hypothetical protein
VDLKDLDTIAKIAEFVKGKVQDYRHDIEKKAKVAEELTPLFTLDAEGWKLLVDRGKFRNGFTRVLGKGGMRALKDLLYEVDKKRYQKIDFGIED